MVGGGVECWRKILGGLAVLCALLITGCGLRVPGTNDVGSEYELEPDAIGDATLVSRVTQRLAVVDIHGAVSVPESGHLRLVVDRRHSETADALVRWTGGVTLYLVDPAFEHGDLPSPFPENRAKVEEYLGEEHWRKHVVQREPLLLADQLPVASLENSDHGRAVAFTFKASGQDALDGVARDHPGALVALVGRGMALAVRPIEDLRATPLVVAWGSDPGAYGVAKRTRQLFALGRTPKVKALHQAERLPIDWGLALASVVLPIAVSFGWLLAIRYLDRKSPEPWRIVLATFALGAASPALLELVPPLLRALPQVQAWLRAREASSLSDVFVATLLMTGIPEEGVKFLAVRLFATRQRAFDEPIDGIVYAGAAALGFAALENFRYFADSHVSVALVVRRGLMTGPGHVLLSTVWGYALGRKLVAPRTRVLPYFLAAAVAHALYDALLETGYFDAAHAVDAGLAMAFVVFVRRALRHGAVGSHTDAVPPATARRHFEVGSYLVSAVSALAMLTFGWQLDALAHHAGAGGSRPDVAFLLESGGLVALFAASFWGVAAAMPLDVALDAIGLTYSGVLYRWAEIQGATVELGRGVIGTRSVLVTTSRGPLSLGPASRSTAEALGLSIRQRIGDD